MFSVGDKVLYPMHGAGTIVGIEEKKILGEKKHYYVFELPTDEIDVMIPVESSDAIGVRPVVSKEKVEEAIEVLSGEKTPMDENWNRRYRDNMSKLKSGEIVLTAEVVRNLTHLGKTRALSQGERKMLANAKLILSSEIVLVLGINTSEAEKLINDSIHMV